jgi:hypothetical protein
VTLLLAVACGLVIGMVLGALGGGGSILAVPALVFVLGESAQDATTASLVVIGISSAIGAISYHRDRHVRWRVGMVFGVVGIGASFGGTALNRNVEEGVLLASFASVMAVSAVAMLTKSWSGRRRPPTRTTSQFSSDADPDGASGPTLRELTPVTQRRSWVRAKVAAQVVVTALLVGFLTGFLGVGGGFIVVPALVMILGYPMSVAAATSLLVIALNAAVSLSIHAGNSPNFDWSIIVPFTAATIVASLFGKRVASRFSSNALTLSFAVVLLLVAAGIGLQVAAPYIGLA